jgi:hypothetical protein
MIERCPYVFGRQRQAVGEFVSLAGDEKGLFPCDAGHVSHNERSLLMTSAFKRGSAPGRSRPAGSRPGTFKPSHEKRGGRKRGTPNAMSYDYKMAILEAAYRVGYDGNGKDGIQGYFNWVCGYHPEIYAVELLGRLVVLEDDEDVESDTSEQPCATGGINQTFREWIEAKPNRTNNRAVHPESPGGWTGQAFPVSALMQVAVEKPKAFCRLLAAAFLQSKTKRRRPAGAHP